MKRTCVPQRRSLCRPHAIRAAPPYPRLHFLAMTSNAPVTKRQYEALANFRYQLRKFLRYSEQITRSHGMTPLQYQLMLHIKGFPGREWATVSELAERMQAKHHGVVS